MIGGPYPSAWSDMDLARMRVDIVLMFVDMGWWNTSVRRTVRIYVDPLYRTTGIVVDLVVGDDPSVMVRPIQYSFRRCYSVREQSTHLARSDKSPGVRVPKAATSPTWMAKV